MRSKSHVLIGISTGVLLKNTFIIQSGLNKIKTNNSNEMLKFMTSNQNNLLQLAAAYKIDAFIALTLGCLVVDIDTDKSKICRTLVPIKNDKFRIFILYALSIFLLLGPNIIVKYFGFLLLLSRLSKKVTYKYYFDVFKLKMETIKYERHRGIFHSLLGLFINTIPIYYIEYSTKLFITAPFILGYMSHLVCDMFNTSGVPLMFPCKKRFKFPFNYRMNRKGKIIENVIVAVYLLFVIYYASVK